MSARYCASTASQLKRDWGLVLDAAWGSEIAVGTMAPIIRRAGAGAASSREAVRARFGVETEAPGVEAPVLAEVAAESLDSAVFAGPVARRQWCIVPAQSMFAWRRASIDEAAQRWRIRRRDGSPFGIGGVWQQAAEQVSFAIITIACDLHPLLAQFGGEAAPPGAPNEQRTPVLLAEEDYDTWLDASPTRAALYCGTFGQDDLDAEAVAAAGASTAVRS